MTDRKNARATPRRKAFVVPIKGLPSHERSFELIKQLSAVLDESPPKEVFLEN